MLNQAERECTPHRRGSYPCVRVWSAAALLLVSAATVPARADTAPPAEDLAQSAELDGVYLALGPRGAAVRSEGGWDAAFGAELSIYRYRDDARLSILGISGGVLQLSELDGGHALAELGAGTRVAGEFRLGAALGITARLSPIRHPRWGAHATVWGFAGAIPYARAGILQDTGMFMDFGVRIALPALRL